MKKIEEKSPLKRFKISKNGINREIMLFVYVFVFVFGMLADSTVLVGGKNDVVGVSTVAVSHDDCWSDCDSDGEDY